MKSEVVILSCESYEEELVYSTLKKGIALLGGWETFLKKEEKILLKPNLVRKTEVERAVITHPAVVKGIVRLLQEEGYVHLSCGDSCGVGSAKKVMEGTGMDQMLEDYGVTIVDFNEGSTVSYPQGHTAKEFFLAKPVQETDALINLCKMKTHALERVTGGVKNLYGCISGLHKAKGHTKYTNADIFARQLIDLNQLIKPRFCVMDGIVAMDGNGPTSGDPVKMKVLLLGNDPVAIDSVYCHLVHLDPQMVPTNVHGETMGLGTWREENIRLLTDGGEITMQEAVERFGNPDFNVDMLSSQHHMSRTSFFNKLKALTGYAPADYIRMIRLQHAAQLLKQGEYTIAEITDMVGFSDAKYFREVFKKYYGVSPSKYGESEKTGSYPAINLKNEK